MGARPGPDPPSGRTGRGFILVRPGRLRRGLRDDLGSIGVRELRKKELEGLDQLVHWVLHTAREALETSGDENAGLASATAAGAATRPRTGAVFGNLGFPSEGMAAFARSVWIGNGNGRDPDAVDPRNRFMSGGTAALLWRALGLGAGAFASTPPARRRSTRSSSPATGSTTARADLMLAGAVQRADDLFLHVGFSRSRRPEPAAAGAGRSTRSRRARARGGRRAAWSSSGSRTRSRTPTASSASSAASGLSNDGRGHGLLAPAEEGQVRAMRAAYAVAGLDPRDVSLLECHATGTPRGRRRRDPQHGARLRGTRRGRRSARSSRTSAT